MNKGTAEGTAEEIKFVKTMNKKNIHFWKVLGLDPKNHYAVHVSGHKFGLVNQKKVKPKADVFIGKGEIPVEYLIENDFFISEKDADIFNLTPIDCSGISVKRVDSQRYTILKMNPSTFKKIFNALELGAGASIYCRNEEILSKTPQYYLVGELTGNNLLNFLKINAILILS